MRNDHRSAIGWSGIVFDYQKGNQLKRNSLIGYHQKKVDYMAIESSSKAEDSFMYKDLTLGRKVSFALGFMGQQIFNGTQTASTAWFWLNIIGIEPTAYSIIMLVIYNIWNAVNDPIFGYLSDKTRTRWGRRRPWMWVFAPLWWVFFSLLYMPVVSGQWPLIIWFGTLIVMYDLCYTIVGTNYNALGAELSTKTRERVQINLFSNLFGLVGNGIGFIIPLIFRNNVNMFKIAVVIAGGVAVGLYAIPAFTVKERPIPKEEEELSMKFGKSFATCFRNKAFWTFAGMYFLKEVSASIMLSIIVFYTTFHLQSSGIWNTLLLVVLLAFSIPGFFIWTAVHKKVGTKKVMIISTILFALTFPLLSLVTPAWEPTIFGFQLIAEFQALIILALSGISLAGTNQFPYVMLAEAIDYDEIQTNQRREAAYFGSHALATKPGLGVGQALLAGILAWTGFRKDLVFSDGTVFHYAQSNVVILGIRLLMGVIPALFVALSLIFILQYPFTKEKTLEMKAMLAEIHKKKFGNLRADT